MMLPKVEVGLISSCGRQEPICDRAFGKGSGDEA